MHFTPIHAATVAFVAAAGLDLARARPDGHHVRPGGRHPGHHGHRRHNPEHAAPDQHCPQLGGVPITGEQRGQLGGTTSTVKPGASDTELGVTPRR